ncbi:hypothetical protein VNO77_36853 [Canavalia gladiata]|uniref:Uncharacterized protein n=1 Tax=Canavalia gladiata TaxID=3824 RepID=A0AAN9PWF7_CANGL
MLVPRRAKKQHHSIHVTWEHYPDFYPSNYSCSLRLVSTSLLTSTSSHDLAASPPIQTDQNHFPICFYYHRWLFPGGLVGVKESHGSQSNLLIEFSNARVALSSSLQGISPQPVSHPKLVGYIGKTWLMHTLSKESEGSDDPLVGVFCKHAVVDQACLTFLARQYFNIKSLIKLLRGAGFDAQQLAVVSNSVFDGS